MQSRQRILHVARVHFASRGYDKTTMRAVAADAAVDTAMVYYFFGSKQELFKVAMNLPAVPGQTLARLIGAGLDELGPRLVRRCLEVWDGADDLDPVLSMLRSAPTSDMSASMVRDFLQREIGDELVRTLGTADASLRVSLLAAQLIGLAVARYQLRIEPIATTSPDTLAAWLGPLLQQCLMGPAPPRHVISPDIGDHHDDKTSAAQPGGHR